MAADEPHVLLAGYRAGVVRALRAAGIPFDVWHDRELRARLRGVRVHVAPFGATRRAVESALADLTASETYTHVIATLERSVYAASLARRVVGARRSTHTVVQRCYDKLEMKEYLHRHGIPMTPFLRLGPDESLADVRGLPGTAVVVKSRIGSGGRGMRVFRDLSEIDDDVARGSLVEAFVDAPEASIEGFVVDGRVRFVNVTDYRVKRRVNVVPAPFAPSLLEEIVALHRRVVGALRIEWGLTHMEVYLTRGGVLFGEIALRPPGGYIMDAMRLAYGFDPWAALVAVELGRPARFPASARRAAAVVVLDPGPGRVTAVRGVEATRAHPAVRSCRLRVEVGDTIAAREGAGSDSGRVLLASSSAERLDQALEFVDRTLHIETRPEVTPPDAARNPPR